MATINKIQKYLLSPLLWGSCIGLLSGCVKDTIYNTDHPDKARVTINTMWSDIGTGITRPATYIVAAGNVKEETNANKHVLNTPLEPGVQTFCLYNNVPQIPVTDGVATVNTVTTPRLEEATYIEPLPGWLFTGTLTHELEKDSEYQLTINMHQQVRQLALLIDPQGPSVDRITGIKATLAGVARQFDIINNTHTQPSNTTLSFNKITEGDDAGKWLSTVRLLGISGGEQKLTVTIYFSDGSPQDTVLESDLSSSLSDFNNNKKEPLSLGTQIIEVPTGAGFTATITDWEKVISGTGVAQ